MPLLVIFITIACIFIAFLSNNPVSLPNPFLTFYFSELNFFLDHMVVFLVGFFILTLISLRSVGFASNKSFSNTMSRAFFQVFATVIVGSFLAFFVLLCVALIQLNFVALSINTNTRLTGIITNKKEIASALKTSTGQLAFMTTDPNPEKVLVAIATATTGSGNIYSAILPSIPSWTIMKTHGTTPSVLLIDNTLIVTAVNPQDMQQIAPFLGHLLVQQYFPDRRIKSYPKVAIMKPSEYQKFRESDNDEKIKNINLVIKNLEENISSLSGILQNDTEKIAYNQSLLAQFTSRRDAEYSKCVNAGEYIAGKFTRYYTSDHCSNILDASGSAVLSENTVNTLQQKLQDGQSQMAQDKLYEDYFKQLITLTQVSNKNVTNELGVFVNPVNIKIDLQQTSSHTLPEYLETVTHEYMHYASYSPKKSLSSLFFEEGLTEYFARQIIQDSLHVSTNLGYPVQVKIITEMAKIIPESELADIYFTKDEAHLERALDRVYGDGFYAANSVLFNTIQYSSENSQTLKVANDIMARIGGAPLKEKDLLSTLE